MSNKKKIIGICILIVGIALLSILVLKLTAKKKIITDSDKEIHIQTDNPTGVLAAEKDIKVEVGRADIKESKTNVYVNVENLTSTAIDAKIKVKLDNSSGITVLENVVDVNDIQPGSTRSIITVFNYKYKDVSVNYEVLK